MFRRAFERWKHAARKIGDVQARLLLSVFYIVIVGPFAVVVRRKDPLGIHHKNQPRWNPRAEPPVAEIDRAREQF